MKACLLLRVLFLGIFASTSVGAFAKIYERQDNSNTDVIYLEDARVDFELRRRLIEEAQVSIDMISLSQTTDEVGGPILQALRSAANRGIKIRYAYESIASAFEGDISKSSSKLLADKDLKLPAQVIIARLTQKWRHGLAYDDFIHEKLLIIDAGTPMEKVIIGGRGYSKFSISTMDSAFLLRPVVFGKAYVGHDMVDFFEGFWTFLKTIYQIEKPKRLSRKLRKFDDFVFAPMIERTEASHGELAQLREIVNLLKQPPTQEINELASFEFRPESSQFVSSETLDQVVEDKPGRSVNDRKGLHSDIDELLEKFIQNSDRINLSTYAVGFPDSLRESLESALERGASLKIYSNGRGAHQKLIPKGVAVDYTYQNLMPLYECAKKSPGKLSVYLLNATIAREDEAEGDQDAFDYLHRKLAVFDEWLGTGSDNFTRSSSMKNDEIFVFFKDPRLMSKLVEQQGHEMRNFNRINEVQAKKDYNSRPWFSSWLKLFVQATY